MKLPYIVTSVNTAQTERIGAEFAKWILAHKRDGEGCFVALYGDLGAGKTAFIRGAVSVAAPQAHTQSPTYTIVNEYASGRVPVYHMDVYRLQTEDDLYSVGFFDYLEQDAICFCEWCEKIRPYLPANHFSVTIQKALSAKERNIEIREVLHYADFGD